MKYFEKKGHKSFRSIDVKKDKQANIRSWRAYASLFVLLGLAVILDHLFHRRGGYSWLGHRASRRGLLAAHRDLADRHGSLYGTEYAMLGRKGFECRRRWIVYGKVCNPDNYAAVELDVLWLWQNMSDPRRVQRLQSLQSVQAATSNDTFITNTCVMTNINHSASFDRLRFSLRSAQKHLTEGFSTLHLLTPDYETTFRKKTKVSVLRNTVQFLRTLTRQMKHNSTMSEVNSNSPMTSLENGSLSAPSSSSLNDAGFTKSGVHFVDEIGRSRIGQSPKWLKEHRDYQSINIKHHWNAACGTSRQATKKNPHAVQRSWDRLSSFACKEKRLPTFNPTVTDTIAHEGQGLSDIVVHVKDHHFFGSDVSSSDFYTPVYGPVFRVAFTGVTQDLESTPDGSDLPGMAAANALLSRRFGHRDRPKLLNIPRVAVQTLNDEARNIWSKEISKATLNRCPGKGDLNVPYLIAHYAIERHREALLWSFFVARSDKNGDDSYNGRELKTLLGDMGLKMSTMPAKGESLPVYYPKRTSLHNETYEKNIAEAKFPIPRMKDVTFTSQDGFYGAPLWERQINVTTRWPNYDASSWSPDDKYLKACRLSDVCFDPFRLEEGDQDPKASEVFKYFTFQRWGCGDCLILLLLSKSGDRGLKAFLPSSDSRFPEAHSVYISGHLPHLPYKAHFEKQDFSLEGVARETNLGFANRLNFVTSLLVRYQYALAQGKEETDTVLQDRYEPKNQLVELELIKPKLFSIRDNTTDKALLSDLASHAWLKLRYPEAIPFETIAKPRSVHHSHGALNASTSSL